MEIDAKIFLLDWVIFIKVLELFIAIHLLNSPRAHVVDIMAAAWPRFPEPMSSLQRTKRARMWPPQQNPFKIRVRQQKAKLWRKIESATFFMHGRFFFLSFSILLTPRCQWSTCKIRGSQNGADFLKVMVLERVWQLFLNPGIIIFFCFLLLTHEGRLTYGGQPGFPTQLDNFSRSGAKGCSDHRFRAPPAYSVQLITLYQYKANNQ